MSKLKLTVNEAKTRVCHPPEEKSIFWVTRRSMLFAEDRPLLHRDGPVKEADHPCL
jgi:hypothetical protein